MLPLTVAHACYHHCPLYPCTQDVSQAIIGKVEELSAAVVVMPEQRQTLFESLFMQTSVATQVAQHCKRPTVLIR